MNIANDVAMNNSNVSELFESKYGERIINVPRTMPNPGNDSIKILVEGLVIIFSDNCHLFNTLTKINGDMNLKINVNIAKGHRSCGEVEAK